MAQPTKTWTVTDPSGKVHTKRSATREYTHVIVRQNRFLSDPDHYFVSWATSQDKAVKESRVHADQRAYNEVVNLDPPVS